LVDLFLSHNTKVRIISTYIPSNDKELLQNTQEKVLAWVQQAKRKNMLIITIRDFNDNVTKKKSKNQMLLLSNLLKNNVLSSLDFFAIMDITWKRNQSASQINDIWISAEIIHEFIKPELWEAEEVTDSNHVIMKTTTTLHNALKKVNSICRFCKKPPTPLFYKECIMQINKELAYVKCETKYENPIVSAMSWYTKNKTKLEQQIDALRKALHKAKEVENQKEKREQIQSHIIRRKEKFTDNTKGIIKSVLKSKVALVMLNNLKQKDAIITDARRIKKEVEEHFSKWTNMNTSATPIWQKG
ncbi:30165_t:CDS:2, partial [Gigaspora margarita]